MKFSEFEKQRNASLQEDAGNTATGETSELLAQIADLSSQRKLHIKNKESFKAQILEIEIKLRKLEVERIELMQRKLELEGAEEISKNRRKEGKGYE
jgi:hypothetical protein